MLATELPDWLVRSFSGLPCGSDPSFFDQLWSKRRLRFHGTGQRAADAIDELSARLSCAALSKPKQLLIVLPDRQARRPALLFTTCLIIKNRERRRVSQIGGQVLYFGSSVGIRTYLSQTSIGNLTLDSVLPHTRMVGRDSSQASAEQQKIIPSEEIEKLGLPQVLCVYSPADPVSIVQQNPAEWVAVDCGDGRTPIWLASLLKHARACKLPLIAWGQNLLSECTVEFARAGGHVFHWPQLPELITKVTPMILRGVSVDVLSDHLRSAELCLIQGVHSATGRLGEDAVSFAWATLRSLEGLPVPFDLYEVEAKSFWGLRTISRLQRGLQRFLEAILPVYPKLAVTLEQACTHLDGAVGHLKTAEPPLWAALTDLCVADVPAGVARVIIFPTAARKQIFIFALLSRLNITEEDLRELRIWICSLKEFHQVIYSKEPPDNATEHDGGNLPRNLKLLPILIGIPSTLVSWRLESLFRCEELEILLYPHQGSVLTRRISLWKKALEVDLAEEVKIVSYFGGDVRSSLGQKLQCQRLLLQAPKGYEVERSKEATSKAIASTPWQPKDPVEEVKWLLQAENDVDEDGFSPQLSEIKEITDETSADADDGDSAWVEEAISFRLADGWHALFATDDTIQVIVPTPEGDTIEERYVRSLRAGDRVLFIHGLRRQSLYDLIVSRVHRNPAIELHLALIQRWQDDFRQAYRRRWEERQRSLEELLNALQARGSELVSTQTLRFWLRGKTLCPDDAEDLRRLSEELGLVFVQQYYRRIHSAAQRIAGIHRGLALKLNHWLRRGAPATGEGMDETLDPELGLKFQDFRDSLMILRVEGVERKTGPFSRGSLGQLER